MSAEATDDPYAVDARYYDLIHDGFEDDIGLWLSFAGRTEHPVLEVGAGSGRVAVALAQGGFAVTGLEPSPSMLHLARERSRHARADVRWVEGRLPVAFIERERFGLVIVALDTFLYCEDQAAQIALLTAAAEALHFNGTLILDLPGPGAWLDPASSGQPLLAWSGETAEGYLHVWHVREDDVAAQQRRLEILYETTTQDGTLRREIAVHLLRYVGRFEVELLLAAAGLAVEAAYGDYQLGPLTNDSQRMIVTARRAEG
jgi:SAM-dependent methyltransferase